jgi:hypothetical protein
MGRSRTSIDAVQKFQPEPQKSATPRREALKFGSAKLDYGII